MELRNGFLLGASTAAHQVEGNNVNSDCWVMENLEHTTYTEPSGIAADHYNRYAEDIKMLADAGLNAYRFSIEWARIEPREGEFDEGEIAHYRDVLDCCYANGVTPLVTLHHFSSPAWLISKGGWKSEYAVAAFERYVRFLLERLGGKIPVICTINEANMGYQIGKIMQDMMKASAREGDVQVGVNLDGGMERMMKSMTEQGEAFGCDPRAVAPFVHPRSQTDEVIVMKAHQAAVRAVRELAPHAKAGLTLSLYDLQVADGGEQNAAELWQDDFGFYLPYIESDDFLGVQNYSRKIVDANGSREPAPDARLTQMGYEYYPEAIGNVCRRVAARFKGDIYITENGVATSDDAERREFIDRALAGVKRAMDDGVPIKGYCHWSLIDNFEWQMGFSKTFGLCAFDRETLERSPKPSLKHLGKVGAEIFG